MLNFKILQNLRFLHSGVYPLKQRRIGSFLEADGDFSNSNDLSKDSKEINIRQEKGLPAPHLHKEVLKNMFQ